MKKFPRAIYPSTRAEDYADMKAVERQIRLRLAMSKAKQAKHRRKENGMGN